MRIKIEKGIFEACKDIRTKVFVQEQGFEEEFDDIDDIAYHIVLFDGDIAIATGRTFLKEENIYKIGRVAVLKEYRKKDYGKIIIKELENIIKNENGTEIHLSSQLHAIKFYERCGFVQFGDIYLEDGADHILMKKSI